MRDIKRAFPYKATKCGIYEWKAEKPGRRSVVVYVGSTCRGKPGSLRDRINEYCNDGSHKSELINDALHRGYTLLVRVKAARSSENAEELEKAYLDRYDYAWNCTISGLKNVNKLKPATNNNCVSMRTPQDKRPGT